jgi:GNAT superfamily N-acetyltransferase
MRAAHENGKRDVVAVTAKHADLLEALFATSAGMHECWCMWPCSRRGEHRPDAGRNRLAMLARIESDGSPGLICLDGARPVGWCALGALRSYPQYPAIDAAPEAWAIPCIYIESSAERDEVAHALIEAAAERARALGASTLYGPPPWWLPGDQSAIRAAVRTFLKNGFVETGSGARMPELRRALSAPADGRGRGRLIRPE